MKKRLIAALLLAAKIFTLVGCTSNDNDKKESSPSSSLLTTVEDTIQTVPALDNTEKFEQPSSEFPTKGLSIQKEEIINDDLTGDNIAIVRYLNDDETQTLSYIDIYSSSLSTRIDGEDIESKANDILNSILIKYTTYSVDVYENGSNYKSYTLYQSSEESQIAKCVYCYSSDGELKSTTYYGKDNELLMVIENDKDNAVQTIYSKSKIGCKYEKKYVNGNIVGINFYNSDNKIEDSITIYECSYEPTIIDDNGYFQVITMSKTDQKTYTISENGKIIYEKATEYKSDNTENEITSNTVVQLQKEKIILGGDSSNGLEIKIDYYVSGNSDNSASTPARTEITSNYLEEPIIINYELNEKGEYIPRDNQMKTGKITEPQMFGGDPNNDIEYYIEKIKNKYVKKTGNDKTKFSNIYSIFQFDKDERLKKETKYSSDDTPLSSEEYKYGTGDDYWCTLTYYKKNGEKSSTIHYEDGTLDSYTMYLTSKNGCKYEDTTYYERTNNIDQYYAGYRKTLAFNDKNGYFSGTFIETSGILHKHNVGNFLVLDIQSYYNNTRTREIYEINPAGHLQYRIFIIEIYGHDVTVIRESFDNNGKTKYYESQKYELQNFNLDDERKYLPWLDEYNDSWEKLKNDNDGLSYIGTITPDASLQSSTLTAPDGELTTWELPGETFSEGANHILKRL